MKKKRHEKSDDEYVFSRDINEQEESRRHKRKSLPRLGGHTYYWVVAKKEGRTLILPGGESEEKANRVGLEKLDGYFEVVPLQTRDKSEAAARIKGQRLEDGLGISRSLEWIKHKIKRKGEGEAEC